VSHVGLDEQYVELQDYRNNWLMVVLQMVCFFILHLNELDGMDDGHGATDVPQNFKYRFESSFSMPLIYYTEVLK
jgi:hypothetical protein